VLLHSLLLQVAVLRCVLTLRLVLLVVLLPPRCAPSLLAFHSAARSLVSAEFACHCSVLIASMQMWHDLLVMALCWLMHGHSSHSSMDLAKASCNGATACRAMSCGMVARRFLQVNVPPPLTQHDMQSRDAQNKCLTCAPSAELRRSKPFGECRKAGDSWEHQCWSPLRCRLLFIYRCHTVIA